MQQCWEMTIFMFRSISQVETVTIVLETQLLYLDILTFIMRANNKKLSL